MKEFEKWKSKNCDDKGCPHEASCNCCEHIWRAALGWIHEYMVEQEPDTPYFDYVLLNKIEKELGDT